MSLEVGASDHLSIFGRRLNLPSGMTVTEATPGGGDVTLSNGGSVPFVGETDPATLIASGTEYVWFQMDGTGTLVDIIYGKAA